MAAAPVIRNEVSQRREILGSPASLLPELEKKGVACRRSPVLASRAPDDLAKRG